MQEIISDNEKGIIKISDKFDISLPQSSPNAAPQLQNPGEFWTVSFVNLQNVSKLSKFSYDSLGTMDTRTLKTTYRVSRDGLSWTEFFDLKSSIDNFPLIDTKDPLYLDVRWERGGTSTIGTIRILEYLIEGELERYESTGESTINLSSGQSTVLAAPFIYKVFSITDIEIISNSDLSAVEIKWRFSQDNSRTWSEWEPFTKENVTTKRINPIRFFQIEYSITNKSSGNVSIQDINLIGDFQNVTNDYFKTNLYGIRECCLSNTLGYVDPSGNFIPADNGGSGISSGGGCETGVFTELTSQDKANLYNPYQQNSAMNLLNKLSADAEQVFGHKVIYFCTDPDKRGQDHTLHEYQLYNVVCDGTIKASVEGNNFPDSQIVMNQFDLSLFENMTVNITKKQFKEVFGPQRRPSKEDFLYFCDVNRMFQVEHAQQFRGFNNAAIYYKLILKKYNQKSNVQAIDQTIKDKISNLNKNSTIDELFGVKNSEDKVAVANKDQFKPLTREPIRLDVLAQIDKELIENSRTIIAKAHYDLSSVAFGTEAVRYKNLRPRIKVSDNIAFYCWFNLNNYVVDEEFNFIKQFDEDNSIGWKINLINDSIKIELNSTTYTWDLLNYPSDEVIALQEETWYCYAVNFDQRQRKLQQWIYKRDSEFEEDAPTLATNILQLVYSNEIDMTPVEFEIENAPCQILGSDMKLTNVRLFLDVLPVQTHNKILNQYIIGEDSKYLVFADNATTRLYLPRFPLFE